MLLRDRFEVMMKAFNPHASRAARAIQVWQILVGKAMDRQTITYEHLSTLMYGRRAPRALGAILGHVAYYCNQNRLPPLTVIVVSSMTGVPGPDIPVPRSKLNQKREKVFRRNWYDLYPPSEDALLDAFEAG